MLKYSCQTAKWHQIFVMQNLTKEHLVPQLHLSIAGNLLLFLNINFFTTY